ncbi:hypothetical protein QM012_009182 [Aureobasidium pullulans]|uniref:Aminoglycoside phosphotransferase domain-containing protein n=1 Tax=Aureobasidium pullulans TaxID=5580 RepID=A0ABR0THM8_AURPU
MISSRKRARTEEDDDSIASGHENAADVDHVTKNDHPSASDTPAAKFNRLVMRKLTKAMERDPETDLTKIIPSTYLAILAARLSDQDQSDKNDTTASNGKCAGNEEHNNQAFLPAENAPEASDLQPVEMIFPISSTVRSCLGLPDGEPNGQEFMATLSKSLAGAEKIFQSQTDKDHYVARCSQDLVVKVSEVHLSPVTSQRDFTEYTSMQFLAQNKPDFPAPRPHGLLVYDKYSYCFMTYVSGSTLESVWSTLAEDQKACLTNDLNCLLLDLRSISLPNEAPLGGVAGEGCKDARRDLRRAQNALYTIEEFWEFRYGHPRNHGTSYCRVLRQVTFPPRAQKIFFTHGDLHPANVVVRVDDQGQWTISGLIDWEMSGFYPEDFECVKATNRLSPLEDEDWYSYLPSCISPQTYSHGWFSDRLWDTWIV